MTRVVGESLPAGAQGLSLATVPLAHTTREPPHQWLTDARARDRLGQWELCLVVAGPQRVVLGLIRAETLGVGDNRSVVEVMQEGPSTYRPHVTAGEMSTNLKDTPAPWVVVTTLSGHLMGVVMAERIHAAAGGTTADPDPSPGARA